MLAALNGIRLALLGARVIEIVVALHRHREVGLLDAAENLLVQSSPEAACVGAIALLGVLVLRFEIGDHIRICAVAQPEIIVDARVAVKGDFLGNDLARAGGVIGSPLSPCTARSPTRDDSPTRDCAGLSWWASARRLSIENSRSMTEIFESVRTARAAGSRALRPCFTSASAEVALLGRIHSDQRRDIRQPIADQHHLIDDRLAS